MFLVSCFTAIQNLSFDEFRFGFIVNSALGVFIIKSLNISPELNNEYQIYALLFEFQYHYIDIFDKIHFLIKKDSFYTPIIQKTGLNSK